MEPIRYVEKLNNYYRKKGFPPYKWSVLEAAPFKELDKPLADCTVSLLTTGGLSERANAPFDANAKNDHRLDAIARDVPTSSFQIHDNYYSHTDAEKDINCIFPLDRIREFELEGLIGRVSDRVWSGFMGRTYDRTRIVETSAPSFFAELVNDKVDLLIAIPACPLDHQTAGLVCRVVEELGISTVCIATARDIIEQVQPPRSVFVNYPLGNNLGKPHDASMQRSILRMALELGRDATRGGVLLDAPYEWPEILSYDI